MVKKKKHAEDDIITKLSNPWEFLGYALRYRTKELLAVLAVVLAGVVVLTNKEELVKLFARFLAE